MVALRMRPPPCCQAAAPETAPGVPGASLASGFHQPLYAWLSQSLFATKSLAAACDEQTHGVLLLEYPQEQANVSSKRDAGFM